MTARSTAAKRSSRSSDLLDDGFTVCLAKSKDFSKVYKSYVDFCTRMRERHNAIARERMTDVLNRLWETIEQADIPLSKGKVRLVLSQMVVEQGEFIVVTPMPADGAVTIDTILNDHLLIVPTTFEDRNADETASVTISLTYYIYEELRKAMPNMLTARYPHGNVTVVSKPMRARTAFTVPAHLVITVGIPKHLYDEVRVTKKSKRSKPSRTQSGSKSQKARG